MKQSSHDWFEDIKNLFLSINAPDVLECNVPIINDKQFYRYAEGKLMADYSPQWSTLIQQKPKLYYYKQIKNEYKAENYCYINLKKFQRSLLAKFRLGMFPINIELCRYQRIPREQRFCPLCDLDQVEDELHILFDCPRYCELCKPLFEQAALTDALLMMSVILIKWKF